MTCDGPIPHPMIGGLIISRLVCIIKSGAGNSGTIGEVHLTVTRRCVEPGAEVEFGTDRLSRRGQQ
eukprot:145523-Hanusia_phi.AAC.1